MSDESYSARLGPVQVRPARLADIESMKAVWQDSFGSDVFGGETRFDEYFEWAFVSNPDCRAGTISNWVGEMEGDVVAAWSTMPAPLLIQDKLCEACWLQATAVASRAQRRGVGRRMFRDIIASYPLTLGVGVVEASRALYTAEGVHVVRADRFAVLQLSKRMMARSLLKAIYRRQFRTARSVLGRVIFRSLTALRQTRSSVQIAPTVRFTSDIDDFLASVSSAIPVMTRRTSAKLNWILDNPRIETVAFTATRADKPCGYVILRRDGMLLDLLVQPKDAETFAEIIGYVSAWAKDRSINELSGIVPGFRPLASLYRAAGFLEHPEVDFGLFYALPEIHRTNPTLSDPENWYLSMTDSDLWSFLLKE